MPRKRTNIPENYNLPLPTRLRELMSDFGYTQADLAAHLGLTRQSVCAYMDGSANPTPIAIVSIAKFLGVSTDYLLGSGGCQKEKNMEQRTCNIIMCCKGHCQLEGAGETSMEAIAAYMSKECACPKEDYKGWLMESILREAMFDYIAGADKPGFELRQLFYQYATHEPSLSERICTMFQLTRVRNDDESYANGFSDKLLAQSEKDLGGKVTVG